MHILTAKIEIDFEKSKLKSAELDQQSDAWLRVYNKWRSPSMLLQ